MSTLRNWYHSFLWWCCLTTRTTRMDLNLNFGDSYQVDTLVSASSCDVSSVKKLLILHYDSLQPVAWIGTTRFYNWVLVKCLGNPGVHELRHPIKGEIVLSQSPYAETPEFATTFDVPLYLSLYSVISVQALSIPYHWTFLNFVFTWQEYNFHLYWRAAASSTNGTTWLGGWDVSDCLLFFSMDQIKNACPVIYNIGPGVNRSHNYYFHQKIKANGVKSALPSQLW